MLLQEVGESSEGQTTLKLLRGQRSFGVTLSAAQITEGFPVERRHHVVRFAVATSSMGEEQVGVVQRGSRGTSVEV